MTEMSNLVVREELYKKRNLQKCFDGNYKVLCFCKEIKHLFG